MASPTPPTTLLLYNAVGVGCYTGIMLVHLHRELLPVASLLVARR